MAISWEKYGDVSMGFVHGILPGCCGFFAHWDDGPLESIGMTHGAPGPERLQLVQKSPISRLG